MAAPNRWRPAARAAAAAFWPTYRAYQKSRRGLGFVTFTRFVAWLYVIGTSLTTIGSVIATFTSRAVSLSLPVQQFWPTLPAGARITGGPTAHVVGGGFTNATVSVAGLDGAARTWLAASILLQGVTVVVVALVVAGLCTTVLNGNPFRPVVSLGIRIMGITVIVGGISWQICSSVAGGIASRQVLQLGSTEISRSIRWHDVNTIIGFPMPSYASPVDLWPLWIGLALLALSLVFRHGIRLQRDTEGLV
jgi:hypothetical protein